jgi:hypothetical protein
MTRPADAFAILRAALEQAGIRYAVGGSWASGAFGEPRFTRDVDIIADFTPQALERFIGSLPKTFYADLEEAQMSIRLGRSFNVICIPIAFKFDLYPARAFPLGIQELDRAVFVVRSELSPDPTPFVTPEDILLAKLHWFQAGSGLSEVQWRDIQGIVRVRSATLDRTYLEQSAIKLGILALLEKALNDK